MPGLRYLGDSLPGPTGMHVHSVDIHGPSLNENDPSLLVVSWGTPSAPYRTPPMPIWLLSVRAFLKI